MEFSSASHIGKVRKNNEDYCDGKIIDTKQGSIGIFALADGMGGHNKGEVASYIAVSNIIDFLEKNLVQDDNVKIDYIDDILRQAYNTVNSIIYKKSFEVEECKGMGTTLVTVVVYNKVIYVANVGDSRCYILDGKKFDKITIDHSVVEQLVLAHVITREEAKHHPQKNQITRAVGTDNMVAVDIFKHFLKSGDVVLMATDGLTGVAEDFMIKETLLEKIGDNLDNTSKDLIDLANNISGKDNISVILIRV
ncbi:MAG: Stp1/IreP family PP2C-type Ser/Thr phosphatase [Clostridioides sp.]|jgi:protein phosphatase|nr:Stp1/IreP family PP2C-type Ser/Thr phosphatase [Clostridioides sp.]